MAKVEFEPWSPEGNPTAVMFCLAFLSLFICHGHFLIGARIRFVVICEGMLSCKGVFFSGLGLCEHVQSHSV